MENNVNTLAAQVALNRTFNKLSDVLDAEGVSLIAGCGVPVLILSNGQALKWYEGLRTHTYKQDRPPIDWDMFVANAAEIYAAKNHDYKQAFTKGLIQFGRSVWAWEVHKKLNRIRTWLEAGGLRVKGEGIADSVNDIFVYTTIYTGWAEATARQENALVADNADNFYKILTKYPAASWVHHLVDEDLIAPSEHELLQLVFTFLAGEGAAYQ